MSDETPAIPAAGTRQGVVLLAASIMPIMAIISLVPILPMLMGEFAGVAGSEFLVPMALTIPALCVALFSPLAGWLSDRLGRKNLLVTMLVLYAAFGILPWFLTDLFQIIGARIVLGITEAVIMTVATTLIGDYYSGERREKWIALQVAVGSFAAIVLVAIGGGLGELLGSRGPFLLYLLALPIALAATTILFEPPVRQDSAAARRTRFPYKTVLPLVLATPFIGVVFYTMIVQLGAVLEISGPVSPGVIGLIGALANLAVAAGTYLFNRFKKHVGPRLLSFGLVLAALGYAGAGSSSQMPMIAGFAILACIGSGIMLPNMLVWTMSLLPPEVRGRGTGLWTGAFFLGQFLAPLVVAAVTGATGTMAAALVAYSIVIAVMAAVTFALAATRKKSPEVAI